MPRSMTGCIGKVGYVIYLVQLYLVGLATPMVFIIAVGDSLFLLVFLFYFYQVYVCQTAEVRNSAYPQ